MDAKAENDAPRDDVKADVLRSRIVSRQQKKPNCRPASGYVARLRTPPNGHYLQEMVCRGWRPETADIDRRCSRELPSFHGMSVLAGTSRKEGGQNAQKHKPKNDPFTRTSLFSICFNIFRARHNGHRQDFLQHRWTKKWGGAFAFLSGFVRWKYYNQRVPGNEASVAAIVPSVSTRTLSLEEPVKNQNNPNVVNMGLTGAMSKLRWDGACLRTDTRSTTWPRNLRSVRKGIRTVMGAACVGEGYHNAQNLYAETEADVRGAGKIWTPGE